MDLERTEFGALLDAIASKSPTPGGGAVASAVGALAAALAGMVIAYSRGRKSLAEHEPELAGAADRLHAARELALGLAREDAEAYGAVSELQKLPATDPRRVRELPGAVEAAIQAPRATMAACLDLLRLFEGLAPIANRNLRSDLAIAGVLAEAAARACRWNVLVNLPLLSDLRTSAGGRKRGGGPEQPIDVLADVERSLAEGRERLERLEAACL